MSSPGQEKSLVNTMTSAIEIRARGSSRLSLESLFSRFFVTALFFTFLVVIVYAVIFRNELVYDSRGVYNITFQSYKELLSSRINYISIIWLSRWYLTAIVFGPIPWIYSLLSIVTHSIAVLLFFSVLKRMVHVRVAFLSTVLFAVHPLLTEAVTWHAGGTYVQYAALFLASFYFYISSRDANRKYLLSIFFWLLTIFTSEKAVSLFAVFIMYELLFGNIRNTYKKLIPYGVICAANVVLILSSFSERQDALILYNNTFSQQIGIVSMLTTTITEYLRLLIWPNKLTLFHTDIPQTKFIYGIRLASLFLICTGTVYCIKKIIQKKDRAGLWGDDSYVSREYQTHSRFFIFWGSLFLIALLPTMFSFGLGMPIAERYVYAASLGFFAIIGYCLEYLYRKQQFQYIVIMLVTLVVITLSIRTIQRNLDWRNDGTLWMSTTKASPSSVQGRNNLGVYYMKQKDYERAVQQFAIAIQLNPDLAQSSFNLATAYIAIGMQAQANNDTGMAKKYYDDAFRLNERALRLNPNLWKTHAQRGELFLLVGKKTEAYNALLQAKKLEPKDPLIDRLIQIASQ